jgi:hypothetical protein
MVTLGMTSTSGSKLSYIYGNDMNGDGQINDLIYVPNSATELNFSPFTVGSQTFTAADQQAAYDAYIDKNPYLKTRRGQYAERNGGALPWLTRFDFTIIQELYIKTGDKGRKNTLQLRLDILNVGNLINNHYGVGWSSTTGSFNTATPVTVSVDNAGNVQYKLATQTINGQTVLLQDSFVKSITLANVWQGQIGIRYTFN